MLAEPLNRAATTYGLARILGSWAGSAGEWLPVNTFYYNRAVSGEQGQPRVG